MQIKYIPVVNPLLSEYVDYYYILSTEANDKAVDYKAYPSINVPLCFIANSSVIRHKNLITVTSKDTSSLTSIVVGHSISPVDISFEPGLKEFAIVFKPIGIHFLLHKKLGGLLSKGLQETNLFDFLKESISLILTKNEDVKILEQLLLQKIHSNAELNYLRQVMNLLLEDHQISFEEITKKIGLPYKNIYRLFKSHKGLSPIQFRRILKFRKALEKSINPSYKSKMSTMALESGYYDQAHCINEMKRITQSTPKNLSLAKWLANGKKTVWKLR